MLSLRSSGREVAPILGIITEFNFVRPVELELLVKLTYTLAHGNAFIKRGMGITKRLVTSRTCLSDISVKAQKMVKQIIDHYGGVTRVPYHKRNDED